MHQEEDRENKITAGNAVLRWVILVPATVLSFIVPGMLFRILTQDILPFFELNPMLLIPGVVEMIQEVINGAAPVYVAIRIAPQNKRVVGFVTGLLLIVMVLVVMFSTFSTEGYWRGVPGTTIAWVTFLGLLSVTSTVVATWYLVIIGER